MERFPNPPEPGADPLPVQLPEGGFKHPFHGEQYDLEPVEGKEHPKTVSDGSFPAPGRLLYALYQIFELRMCALSHHIRKKPDWWEKINDDTIVEKWRGEALQQAMDDDQPEWKLTPGMVCLAYCLVVAVVVLN